MTDRPELTIQQQTAFTADGGLEPIEENVATSLEDFGADMSYREIETRLDRPVGSEFAQSVDDRVEVRYLKGDNTDQTSLFAETADDQLTLTGDDASAQFLFDSPGEHSD
ncbi:hypothetical protein [Natrinema soli]|uniref:Halobacterial output domain-containing protein n=1 Tax=Natrinema soli TaxID=1930624 RepID=A0ABD5SJT4_9EURY|nr:hypothetical protein [Natrinema soli]